MKQWYESKTVWLGIIQFLIGSLTLLGEFLQKQDFSPVAVTLLGTGILSVVLRVWFTNTPVDLGQGNG